MRAFLTWLGVGLLAIVLLAVIGVLTYQRFSDGPTGPLAGGSFRSGTPVEAPAQDWSKLKGDFEFELLANGTSRTAGGVMLDGRAYVTCDLGFIWSRLPEGTTKRILRTIWWLKDWHETAEADGRARIRKDGKIYTVRLERVHDAEEIEQLKQVLEGEAAAFFAPNPVGPRPVDGPSDIWFFRIETS